MKKELLENLLKHDLQASIKGMILPSRNFTGGVYPYNFDFNLDSLDRKNLIVRTHKFMEQMLDFDDFTDEVNKLIYKLETEKNDYGFSNRKLFDYEVFEELEKIYDVEKWIGGYTYNDPDHCFLDRDIHYTIFGYDGDYYVIMLVHYGADARVGFGDVACFKVEDVDYFHIGMGISVYDHVTDEDYNVWELEDIATYNKDTDEWVHNETGRELSLYTSAEGF